MLRIREVYPGSKFFPSLIPDSHKKFKHFNPKKLFLSPRKYDPGCSSRIQILIFLPIPDPGNTGVKKTPDPEFRILDPDPHHWECLSFFKENKYMYLCYNRRTPRHQGDLQQGGGEDLRPPAGELWSEGSCSPPSSSSWSLAGSPTRSLTSLQHILVAFFSINLIP